MSDQMPYGADTIVIPFRIIPDPKPEPMPAQKPEEPDRTRDD